MMRIVDDELLRLFFLLFFSQHLGYRGEGKGRGEGTEKSSNSPSGVLVRESTLLQLLELE